VNYFSFGYPREAFREINSTFDTVWSSISNGAASGPSVRRDL